MTTGSPAERQAPPQISDEAKLVAELRDAIAECLYEAANENEHGPGGGVPYWREFTDSWVMGAVREVVEDMQGRLESFQNGYGSLIGSRERVQAVLAEVLGAERKCQSTADDVRLALDTRAAEVRRQADEIQELRSIYGELADLAERLSERPAASASDDFVEWVENREGELRMILGAMAPRGGDGS